MDSSSRSPNSGHSTALLAWLWLAVSLLAYAWQFADLVDALRARLG